MTITSNTMLMDVLSCLSSPGSAPTTSLTLPGPHPVWLLVVCTSKRWWVPCFPQNSSSSLVLPATSSSQLSILAPPWANLTSANSCPWDSIALKTENLWWVPILWLAAPSTCVYSTTVTTCLASASVLLIRFTTVPRVRLLAVRPWWLLLPSCEPVNHII